MKKIMLLIPPLLCSVGLFSQKVQMEEQAVYSTEVYFDFGKDDIRADADSTLRQLVEFCKDQPSIFIKITAHTDNIGSDANNYALSGRRAEAVKNFLSEKEVRADSLAIAVFGEKRPAATNQTDEGRQQNRRATVEVIELKKMIPLTGAVVNKETGEGIKAEVVIRSKTSRDSMQTDEKGQFKSLVPLGEVIGLDVWAKGYFLETKMFKATPDAVTDLDIELPPVREGERVDIKNLYFVGNQAVLIKTSEPELPKILKFMQINDSISIEIAGHVNHPNRPPVTQSSWEYGLSVRRALLVYNFLKNHGISEDRISYKGYGNWEMRFPKATSEKEMQANRRVEIRVLEAGGK